MSDSYILEIKNKRKDFINSFEKNIENIDNELIRASNDNQLNSIRIHKYLTETGVLGKVKTCLLYTSPSPRDVGISRMPSSA